MSVYLVAYDIKDDEEEQNFRMKFDDCVKEFRQKYRAQKILNTTYVTDDCDCSPETIDHEFVESRDSILTKLHREEKCLDTKLEMCILALDTKSQFALIGTESKYNIWLKKRFTTK